MTTKGRRDASARILGRVRVQQLKALKEKARTLNDMTSGAFGAEVTLVPLDPAGFAKLAASVVGSDESWVYVANEPEGLYLAMDEASEIASRHPAQAVLYSPIHTQLLSWWLFHTWRSLDLIQDAVTALHDWRPYPAAVLGRAVIEQCGCLLYESHKIAAAWDEAKRYTPADELARANRVRELLNPLMKSTSLGTRVSTMVDGHGLRATNVLTYVNKLAASTGNTEILKWYDWLSDAAHPAFGARIASSSDAFVHESRAVMLRYIDRSPLHLTDAEGTTPSKYPIVAYAADAVTVCGFLTFEVLEQMLQIIDDFGLTTAAATFTRRSYWRNLKPTKGNRQCECGRGKWAECAHRWGSPSPSLRIDE